ncbi:SPOR domain-containing protein [Candidatus Saganbacteria bacterium]|nr:SPOR domain-containing protein [Candidatus Saganbacteria bacterium]
MAELNHNPDQSEAPANDPVLHGIPRRSRFWLAAKGILIPLFLIFVIVGSFWLSFNLGKRILLPLKKEAPSAIKVNIPAPPDNIADLQAAPALNSFASTPGPTIPPALPVAHKTKKMFVVKQPLPVVSGKYYKLQAGVYENKITALESAKKLQAAGFESFVREVQGSWRVQAGAFKKKTQARQLQEQLKTQGFASIIIFE